MAIIILMNFLPSLLLPTRNWMKISPLERQEIAGKTQETPLKDGELQYYYLATQKQNILYMQTY